MAEMSSFKRAKVGCVAVYHNRVIASGFNSHKTHPMQDQYNRYRDIKGQNVLAKVHAEMVVVSQLKRMEIDFSSVEIFIYRACVSRECGVARPCPACMAAILDLGIHSISYTTDVGIAHEKINSDNIA